MLVYKVVETSTVTDEELERILNEWTPRGWTLDGIRFVARDSSRRPAMAFVTFTREVADGPAPSAVVPTAARRKKIP
jgi:hypothetical protein